MSITDNVRAQLIYDGGESVVVPTAMGKPSPNQLIGTVGEQLGELACRICYDSLGKGRSSEELHKHILEVINLSVYEHINFTVRIETGYLEQVMLACLNRKGVWVTVSDDENSVDVTVNLRAILEWERWNRPVNMKGSRLINTLRWFGHVLCPQIIRDDIDLRQIHKKSVLVHELDDDQAWISMYLCGSRGFSHEQVRHRYAISQRSTRYVDEGESPYVMHPLVREWSKDHSHSEAYGLIREAIESDRECYIALVADLEKWLLGKGIDKATARKQARGAARGYLGNALQTEMIYSANVTGWKWILSQRLSKFADAEIREIYVDVLEELKKSRLGNRFAAFETVESPDGLGRILARNEP